jgi:uncharacterized protein YutE (UPF0331/DUF86 family)
MIDRELIDRKITLIAPDLDELQVIGAAGVEAFLDDRRSQALAERYLERVIGRMIDINYHILTESGKPPPKDYYQSFIELGGFVLQPAFARKVAACAGLRNRIAHEYDEIDPEKLFDGLSAAVRDVPVFLRDVRAFSNR